jgi:hypothetical protein
MFEINQSNFASEITFSFIPSTHSVLQNEIPLQALDVQNGIAIFRYTLNNIALFKYQIPNVTKSSY